MTMTAEVPVNQLGLLEAITKAEEPGRPYTPLPDNELRTVPPAAPPAKGSDIILGHMTDAIGMIHDHVLGVLDGLEGKIRELRARIDAERELSVLKVEQYVGLANDSAQAAEDIDHLLDGLRETLDRH
jgi:hypothetical protein